MSGLLGTAMSAKNESGQLWDQAAGREQSLNSARDAFKLADSQQRTQMTGSGAGLGLAAGMSMGATYGSWAGPIGALIGAGVGLIASELF